MSDQKTPDTHLRERLAAVEKELDGLARSLHRGSRVTLLLAVLLLAVVSGYFIYGYSQISAVLQPQEIVGAAATLLDDNVRVARQTLQDEIVRSAPFWAEQLSQQALAAMPGLREKMQGYVLTQSSVALDQIEFTSQEQFQRALSQHRDEFAALAAELKDNEIASDAILDGVRKALEQEVGVEMQRDAGELLSAVRTANERLLKLASGQGLSMDQKLERDALMLAKRIQKQEPLPEVPVSGAPLQGLVDRIKAEAIQREEAADKDGNAAAAANGEKSRVLASLPQGPTSADESQQSADDMAAVASEAKQLRDELMAAIAAADAAAARARSAGNDAKKETDAATAATAELRQAIEAAREALQKVRAAGEDANKASDGDAGSGDDDPAQD